MPSHIAKWGNSLALRLPRRLAEDAQLREGTPVDLHVSGDALIVRPARPKYALPDLLAQETGKERHAETDWGEPQGEEAW